MTGKKGATKAAFKQCKGVQMWVCPRCGSTLARVHETPRYAHIGGHGYLLLPDGFVFVRARDVWLKPRNRLKEGTGRQEGMTRRLLRADESGELRRMMDALAEVEEPKPVVLNVDDLPASIQCPHTQCAVLLELSSVRGVVTSC